MQLEKMSPALRLYTTIFVTGIGVSNIGNFIYLVALNVFVLQLTHSAFAVAGLWVFARIAALITGPWIGSVTDRLSHRKQLISIELCRAVLIGVLPFLTHLYAIYIVLFLLGICGTMFQNVFLPYQTLLIPQVHRKRINAITSTLQYSAFLIGPAIAGALLLHGSAALPLWLDAFSFLVSGCSYFLLPGFDAKNAPIAKTNGWRAISSDWRAALTYLHENALFTSLFCLNASMVVMTVAADAQEVVFAKQALHLGKLGYGLMVTAAGVGFITGSLLLSVLAKRLSTRFLLGIGMLMGAVGYLIYSLAHHFWTAVVGLIVLGLFGSAATVGFTTYRQHAMPVSQMGRINNVVGPPQQLLSILVILLGGYVASTLGVRILMIAASALMCAVGLAVIWLVTMPRHRTTLSVVDAPDAKAP